MYEQSTSRLTTSKAMETKSVTESSPSASNLDLTKAIMLTDATYPDAVHTIWQAKTQSLIEVNKLVCFKSVIEMQTYVTQQCKYKLDPTIEEKCMGFNNAADLALKNCGTIFPMATSHDANITSDLLNSVSEKAIITPEGDILHIAANSHIRTTHHTQSIGYDDVNTNNGQSLLADGVSFPQYTAPYNALPSLEHYTEALPNHLECTDC